MTQPSTSADERSAVRLFALTDAVFAIAMTLLAIDLKVPELGKDATSAELTRALGEQWPSYIAFALSFYLIAKYWVRHHREMRHVVTCTPALVGRTIALLFTITAMPFAAALLGQNGGAGGIAVVVYSGVNAAALLALLSVDRESRRLTADEDRSPSSATDLVCDLVAYLVAAPAAYIFSGHGVVALTVCLVIAGRTAGVMRRRRERHSVTATPPIGPTE
ncbi:TMEM175 family protein [Williamsia maris]|uniref:Membrane protein n=1 Tax=Williamsia maris TaxID=72806 RepID=A0ABT1HF46_9NOCA|nr:TMEM175 family protein [Williamsia maris]MCP2176328.1 putative membrane protein [Williamsia maris]